MDNAPANRRMLVISVEVREIVEPRYFGPASERWWTRDERVIELADGDDAIAVTRRAMDAAAGTVKP